MAASPTAYPTPGVMNNVSPDPVDRYGMARTPSPTPSEVRALTTHIIDYKKYGHWRFWAKKEWIKYYIIGGIILVVTILISVYDKQIVKWLTPAGNWMRHLRFGWLIPIAILFVISFPPLFGHEIVALLVGVIWGLGIGFAIVCAGTFLGEMGNFFAFKYLCRARAEKAEKSSIFYGCLAQIVRDGGFKMALLIRLSVIPGHFSTAVFSTCGMSVWVFALAAFLSLPKQFINVYIGVILEESGTGTETPRDKIISDSVLGVTILITIAAMWYIVKELEKAKPIVVYNRRKLRQAKYSQDLTVPLNTSRPISPASETDIAAPLPKRLSQLGKIINPNKQPQQLRRGSGANMGYGGYTPTFIGQQYGEPDSENDRLYEQFGVRKSMDDVEWEMKPPRAVAENLNGKELKDDSNLHASSSQTSLLPHSGERGQNTPERYTASPDAYGQQLQQSVPPPPLQAQAYPSGPVAGSPATLPANVTFYPPPLQPPPTYPTPYQQQNLPYESRAFQHTDTPVSYPPPQQQQQQSQPPFHTPSDFPPDQQYHNPYDPGYQYPIYSSSQVAPTSTNQTEHGVYQQQLPTSTSAAFSNASSNQSYSEQAALTNPHGPGFEPSQRNQ